MGDKPYIDLCAKRIGDSASLPGKPSSSTWCTRPHGHEPPCEGPPPTVHAPATFDRGKK